MGSKKSMVQDVLDLLKKQKYACALTGRQLTPQTAELDHISPVSKNGSDDIVNLQILHKDINRMKRTMGNTEFIDVCFEVVQYLAMSDPQAASRLLKIATLLTTRDELSNQQLAISSMETKHE